jgi:hypothetical protein
VTSVAGEKFAEPPKKSLNLWPVKRRTFIASRSGAAARCVQNIQKPVRCRNCGCQMKDQTRVPTARSDPQSICAGRGLAAKGVVVLMGVPVATPQRFELGRQKSS